MDLIYVSEELSSVETGKKSKGVPKRAEVSEELSSVETRDVHRK